MATLRDSLLPVADSLRQLPNAFGLRRFAVILRRRTWPAGRIGDDSIAPVNHDVVITPPPRVRYKPAHAGQIEGQPDMHGVQRDRMYHLDKITPFYGTGGYTPQQLRLVVPPGVTNMECLVILIGDDGQLRECTQIPSVIEDDRAFGYSMDVQERKQRTVVLQSISVAAATAVHGNKVQLAATGTFSDGSVFDISNLVQWTSATPSVATVDSLGVASALTAGTSNITATVAGLVSPAAALTVT